jgi:tripartite-type tricarboxylate transporter receptor subunit TctC
MPIIQEETMPVKKSRFARMLLAAACLACAVAVHGQDYPSKPVKIIVPFPPGGGNDAIARTVGEKLQLAWGKSVVVENRVGAGGNVGAEAVFTAAPDGYTLLLSTQGPLVVNKSLYARLAYDPDAFVLISLVAATNSLLVVHPKVPATTLQQLIAYARANPDRLNYASQGVGSAAHLAAELFKSLADVKIVHIPYKGTGPAMVELLAGQVDMMFAEPSAADPHIRAGKLRALGVGSAKRNAALPDLAAIAEVLPGFIALTWYGMVAPPGTPTSITNLLSSAVADALKQPDVAKRMVALGINAIGGTPAEMAQFMDQERERWGRVVRLSGAKAD